MAAANAAHSEALAFLPAHPGFQPLEQAGPAIQMPAPRHDRLHHLVETNVARKPAVGDAAAAVGVGALMSDT